MKNIVSSVIVSWLLIVLILPADATDGGPTEPFERDFVITAYYSPLPGQCCYVKGGEAADKVLNGNGTHGADRTAVKPGMIAAPKSYPFGTRIKLPGIGVGTVHDRGGAIVEQGLTDRLDLWVGSGEEGLARALAFGVQRVRGTVYPNASWQPDENMPLENMAAPFDKLTPYLTAGSLMDLHARFGDNGLSVQMLQNHLKTLGYLAAAPNGHFGEATKAALTAFVADMHLNEPGDQLTLTTAAYLLAALQNAQTAKSVPIVDAQSSASDIRSAQRLMRHLGYYRGRTDGVYNDALFSAILSFQQEKRLVGHKDAPGAGRIGPLTKGELLDERARAMAAADAQQLLLQRRIRESLTKKGLLVTQFLQKGYTGNQVRTLQELLAKKGYFPADKINGVFGDLTKASVAQYQVDAKLVPSVNDANAGRVGPFTLRRLQSDEVISGYRTVRGFGWDAL